LTKEVIGYTAAIVGVIYYIPYVHDVLKGGTKPHAFSWFLWSVLGWIAFAAQIIKGGGPGSWATGAATTCASIVFFFSLVKGEKMFPFFDWISLIGAILALILWRITRDPTLAVVLITTADAIAYFPTFRKTFWKPFEEHLTFYALGALTYGLALLALETYSLATWLFPTEILIMDSLFVGMGLIRRRQLRNTKP